MEWSTITCFHMTINLRGWKRHFRKCHWWVACETCGTCGSTHWTRFRGTWYMCIHHLWSTRTPWNKWSTTVRCGQQQPHSPTGMVITMTEDSCWMNARCAWGRKKISKPICLKIQRVMSSLYQFIPFYPRMSQMYPDVANVCNQITSISTSDFLHFDFAQWKRISLGSWGLTSEETVVRLESNNKEQSFTLPKAEQLQYDAVWCSMQYYAVLVRCSTFCLCCVLCGILLFFHRACYI